MTIFGKKENFSIVNVIKDISLATIRNTCSSLNINDSIVSSISDSNLGNHIINNYYNDLRLDISKKHNLKDAPEFILPKMNSILSCIEYNKLTDNMLANGMSVVSNETKKVIATKITNEIHFYKFDTLKLIKQYTNKVNALIKGSKSSVVGTDLFKIITLSKMDILDTMITKGYLTAPLGYTLGVENVNLSDLAFNGEIKDMELNILRDEEIKTLTNNDMDNIVSIFGNVNDITTISDFNYFISRQNITNINGLILLVLSLMNKYKVTDDKSLIPFVTSAINKLNILVNGYNNRVRLNIITLKTDRLDNELTEIIVLKDNYLNYMNEGGSNKVIFGYVLKDSYDNNNTVSYKGASINELNINKDSLINIYKAKVNNLNLELKNNSIISLRSYYTFALSVVGNLNIDKEKLEDITEYVNSSDLGKLMDTKKMTLDIFRYFILSDTNFNEFMKGFEEADIIINDASQDTLVLYAGYRLVLLYLLNQTTLINK